MGGWVGGWVGTYVEVLHEVLGNVAVVELGEHGGVADVLAHAQLTGSFLLVWGGWVGGWVGW